MTATPAGGENVTIEICGLYTGCRPHDPLVSMNGSEIRVTLTSAEPPDCQCIAVEGTFRTSATARVAPGTYGVVATLVNCGQPTDAGSTSVTVDPSSVIPALDRRGAAALVVLIAIAALWRLRP